MNHRICQKRMLLPSSVGVAMIGALTIFLLQQPVWCQEPPPYQLPAHQTRALQIVSEKLNFPVTSLWIANDTTRHSVYLKQDVRVVEVRSKNRDIQEVVIDDKGNILSSDSREFYDQDPAIKSLRQTLSERLDVPVTALRILSDEILHFRNLDKNIRIIKVEHDLEKVYEVALDENDQIVTLDEIVEQDWMAGKLKYGKYTPDLFKDIQSLGPTETIEVVLWIKYHDPLRQITDEEYRTKTREQLDQERIQALKEKEKRLSLALKPTLDKIEQLRAQIKHVSTGLPHITIVATRAQLDEISKWDEVDVIFKNETGGMPFLDNSSGTINAPSAWNQNISGQNTTVAVIEADGVDFGNKTYHGGGEI